jgi:hypothetical protein
MANSNGLKYHIIKIDADIYIKTNNMLASGLKIFQKVINASNLSDNIVYHVRRQKLHLIMSIIPLCRKFDSNKMENTNTTLSENI